jgi:hypothetical protein
MKNPHRLATLFLILPLLCLAASQRSARAAEDPTDAIEKELLSVIREMDVLSSELDRIKEVVTVPKATSVRLEIRRAGNLPAPAALKVYLSGNVEAERDWSREEKDRFLSGAGPVVLEVPILPGAYEGRVLLSHPSWKTSPVFDFRPSVKVGETFLLRLTLSSPPGGKGPVLAPSPEK